MSQFEKFVAEGNEKADELAKAGAMLDEGFMAEAKAETMQQEKPKEKWVFVEKKSENMKHRTEWRAEADRYRCMRCGRGRKYMKMPGKCTGPKFLSKKFGKM